MSHCPECFQNNITSILTVINVNEKIRICDNDNCVYVEKYDENEVEDKFSSNSKKIIFELNSNSSNSDSLTDSDGDNKTSSEDRKINVNNFKIYNVQRHLFKLLGNTNKDQGMINWFCLPLMLKFNSQICLFLLIHLNLFDSQKISSIKNLKELYYETEDIVNKIPMKIATMFTFKFCQSLYKEHIIFNLWNMQALDLSERVLRSLAKLISSFDSDDLYKTIYWHKEQCSGCDYYMNYLKEDFSVRLMKNYEYLQNMFSYNKQCKKCFGQCAVSITIERLANFIIIDLPNGTENDFKSLLSTSFSNNNGEEIRLQAIIEFRCPFPFEDLPEKVPNISEFMFRRSVRQKIQYRIHFRNTDGWYCVDNKSGLIVKNLMGSDVNINMSDVRLLVYGPCNNVNDMKYNVPPCSLYRELSAFKRPPYRIAEYTQYYNEIKYWLRLFKYRDLYATKLPLSKHEITNLAKKITFKLNYHLSTMLNNDAKNLKTQKVTNVEDCLNSNSDGEESILSSIDVDSMTMFDQDFIKQPEVDPARIPKLCIIPDTQDQSVGTVDDFLTSDRLFSPYCRFESRAPTVEHTIDHLIEWKRKKIRGKNTL